MKKKRVTASNLNIRWGPGTDWETAGGLRKGDIITPLKTEGWVPFVRGEDIFWVSTDFLEDVTEPEAKPVQAGEYDFSTREGTIEAIKAECIKQDLGLPAQVAYVLATVEWETARTFKPVREAFWKDEDWRRRNLSRYYPYYGRGFVQLTWKGNYQKYAAKTGLDLVDNPDLAMDPGTALFILVDGFKTGAFTGAKLERYISDGKTDFRNARRCINGVDRATEIARLAEKYLEDL